MESRAEDKSGAEWVRRKTVGDAFRLLMNIRFASSEEAAHNHGVGWKIGEDSIRNLVGLQVKIAGGTEPRG